MVDLHLHCMLGMQCQEFTMVAADQRNTLSVLVMEDHEDKLYEVSDRIVVGLTGSCGDRTQFAQLLAKNLDLYKMRNKYTLSTPAMAHFTRKTMTDSFATTPILLNVLVAGHDEEQGGQLFSMDFVASCMRVPFATHGLAGLLAVGILADHYRPDLTEAEAYGILKLCVGEIHKRLFTHLPNFSVKCVRKDGVKEMPTISPASIIM